MNETYDLLYTSSEPDFPATFMNWTVLDEDLSLEEVKEAMLDCIQDDVDSRSLIWAYRVVRHGEGGNII